MTIEHRSYKNGKVQSLHCAVGGSTTYAHTLCLLEEGESHEFTAMDSGRLEIVLGTDSFKIFLNNAEQQEHGGRLKVPPSTCHPHVNVRRGERVRVQAEGFPVAFRTTFNTIEAV